jgi:hypothetical protein
MPRFGTGVDSMIEAVAALPELELHVLYCTYSLQNRWWWATFIGRDASPTRPDG